MARYPKIGGKGFQRWVADLSGQRWLRRHPMGRVLQFCADIPCERDFQTTNGPCTPRALAVCIPCAARRVLGRKAS